jgi:hypothetical protein
VNNPTGAGVRATSTQVQAKKKKQLEATEGGGVPESITATVLVNGTTNESTTAMNSSSHNNNNHKTKDSSAPPHTTTTTTEGSTRRNILRKHSADAAHRYDSSHKKQGGHGKGLWKHHAGLVDAEKGDYFNEYEQVAVVLDESDPLYMESEDSKYILTSHGGTVNNETTMRGFDSSGKPVYGPLLTLSEFKLQVSDCLTEYLQDSFDSDEVIRRLQELKCDEYLAQVLVKRVVSTSLDMGPRQREWASRLLTCLHPVPLSNEDMQIGFQVLLDGMEDLSKDVPDAVVSCMCGWLL